MPRTALDHAPGYGYLEGLYLHDGATLVVAGWLTAEEGPMDRIEVRCPALNHVATAQVVQRPDLGRLLHVPGAERSGFIALIPVANADPGKVLDVELVGFRGGVQAGRMTAGYQHFGWPQKFPPREMMLRATSNDDERFWRAGGMKSCHDFVCALEPHLDLGKVRTMLEWGCGAGRLTKHLIDRLPHVRVHGIDIDAEAAAWAGQNLRGEFTSCRTEPPLPYADNTFDLIVSLSVFTHLTLDYQKLWLPELQRVLKPGGTMLATTHGDHAARWIFHRPGEYQRVMSTGFFDGLRDENLKHVASGDYYRSTFQSRAFTEQLWGAWFRPLGYTEAGMNNFQDIFVLRSVK